MVICQERYGTDGTSKFCVTRDIFREPAPAGNLQISICQCDEEATDGPIQSPRRRLIYLQIDSSSLIPLLLEGASQERYCINDIKLYLLDSGCHIICFRSSSEFLLLLSTSHCLEKFLFLLFLTLGWFCHHQCIVTDGIVRGFGSS